MAKLLVTVTIKLSNIVHCSITLHSSLQQQSVLQRSRQWTMGGREVASCPAPAPLTGHITTFSCNFHIERFNNLNYCKDLYKSWYQVAGAVSKYCVSWCQNGRSCTDKRRWERLDDVVVACCYNGWGGTGVNTGGPLPTTPLHTVRGAGGQARWGEGVWQWSRESWLHRSTDLWWWQL